MRQQNPIAVKLAPLLAEYLYTNKQLDLPGIGTFRIESSGMPDTEERKQAQPVSISFQSDPSIKETSDLVSFIASKSGKMKALAASDLESHLQIVHQFLNIGKPFLMEGIGNLSKLRSGQYEFTQGNITGEKMKDIVTKEAGSIAEESFNDYGKTSSAQKMRSGKLLPLLLIIAGIAIAIWVGYRMYQKRVSRNNNDTTAKVNEPKNEETVPVMTDSSQVIKTTDTTKKADTVAIQKPIAVAGTYKFVVEEADKERALLRFNSLKSWGLEIQMETTPDSSFCKLFFRLPASVSDTAKLMDSLRIMYTPVWSKSYVEK